MIVSLYINLNRNKATHKLATPQKKHTNNQNITHKNPKKSIP